MAEVDPPVGETTLHYGTNPMIDEGPLPRLVLWLWGGGPALVLVAAWLLHVGPGREVWLPWGNLVLPETCAMYSRFGMDCPGCGLTRSFIHLVHANPLAAWELNPLSWLLFGYVIAQIPLALARGAGVRTRWLKNMIGINQWGLVTIMMALVVRWGLKLALGGW